MADRVEFTATINVDGVTCRGILFDEIQYKRLELKIGNKNKITIIDYDSDAKNLIKIAVGFLEKTEL